MRDLKRKDKLVEAAGDAYGKTLSLAVLDVCSDESVKQCIDGIKDRHVDVLSKSNITHFIQQIKWSIIYISLPIFPLWFPLS